MEGVAAVAAVPPPLRGRLLTQVGPLAQRSLLRTLRSPPIVITGIGFPLTIYGFTVGGIGKAATKIPGFPTSSYPTFALALMFAFTGIYALVVAGAQLGEDVQTGFIKRLATSSLGGSTLLLGQLAGTIAFAIAQATIFLLIGLAVGAHVAAGIGGAFVIVGLAALYATAGGSLGMMAALRTGSGQAVQGIFPLFMALLFLSSMNMPRELIHAGWFRDVATFNPMSYVIEAPRSLLVHGWDTRSLVLGVAVAASVAFSTIVSTAASLRSLSVRR